VFVKGYKFGLMTLEFKKFSDPNEDAYYKDFLDLLDTDPKVGNDLGIIKVVLVRDSVRIYIPQGTVRPHVPDSTHGAEIPP